MNPGFSETYYLIDNLTLSVPTEPALAFYYDDRGHRVRKENFVYAGDEPIRDITWYVRDVSGSPSCAKFVTSHSYKKRKIYLCKEVH